MNHYIRTSGSVTTDTHTRTHGRENRIMVGTVVKAKVGELEEYLREGCSRRLRKDVSGVVQ